MPRTQPKGGNGSSMDRGSGDSTGIQEAGKGPNTRGALRFK